MALISTFTVNDGATTPVARTFSIAGREGSKTEYRDFSSSLISGNRLFYHDIRRARSDGAANRVLMQFVYPQEGTVEGLTKVVASSSAKVEVNFAPGMSEADRKAFVGLMINTLSQADIKDSIIKVTELS